MTVRYHQEVEQVGKQVVYDMPAEEYHALPRLSSSGIKRLLVSAQDFYVGSWFNPQEREESDAFMLGSAYHKRILEGKDAFDAAYVVKPDCDKRTTAGKQLYAEWLEDHPGAIPIAEDIYEQINKARAGEHFYGGRSEVTVLWDDEETGVPMKARLDYLTDTQIMDLKTFSNSGGKNIDRLLASHVVNYGYHIQAAVYSEAVPDREFVFVFQQTGAINNAIVRPFPANLLLAQQGRDAMRQGINKFADMYRKYGSSTWYDEYQVKPFDDDSFPLYVYE